MDWMVKMKNMSYYMQNLYSQIEKGVLMSLGAREFGYTEFTLSFDINKNEKVVITYDYQEDLYNITRYQGNLLNLRCKESLEGVHVEQLNKILLGFDLRMKYK